MQWNHVKPESGMPSLLTITHEWNFNSRPLPVDVCGKDPIGDYETIQNELKSFSTQASWLLMVIDRWGVTIAGAHCWNANPKPIAYSTSYSILWCWCSNKSPGRDDCWDTRSCDLSEMQQLPQDLNAQVTCSEGFSSGIMCSPSDQVALKPQVIVVNKVDLPEVQATDWSWWQDASTRQLKLYAPGLHKIIWTWILNTDNLDHVWRCTVIVCAVFAGRSTHHVHAQLL